MMVDLNNSLMLVALEFAPTFVAMEVASRMGKIIDKLGEEKTFALRSLCEMLLYDLTSMIVESAILAGLFVSIAIRRPKTIMVLNDNSSKRWRSVHNSNFILTTLL